MIHKQDSLLPVPEGSTVKEKAFSGTRDKTGRKRLVCHGSIEL